MNHTFKLLLLSGVASLSGCQAWYAPQPDDPHYAPVTAQEMMPHYQMTGGIYQEGVGLSLYEDTKAHRVGDIITVNLIESHQAKKHADTTTQKDETAKTAVTPSILGQNIQFNTPGILPLASHNQNDLSLAYDIQRKHNGTGDSNQNNSLNGTITVTVSEVLPNGNLKIRGEKWINLNQGKEFVRLTGIVRPTDINASNTIDSTRIADARITYSGTGDLANASNTGWLANLFNSSIWPF